MVQQQPHISDVDAPAVAQVIDELTVDAPSLKLSIQERIRLTRQCLNCLSDVAQEWVALSCQAKRIPEGSAVRAEEVLAGPVSVARYLQVLLRSLEAIRQTGIPRLPGKPVLSETGRMRVPVFPTSGIYDSLVFFGLQAEAWLQQNDSDRGLFDLSLLEQSATDDATLPLTLVLGAGNVSAIPATDVLTKILQDGERVLLKMNPVNAYLQPVFEQAFQPLISAGLLRIISGDSRTGAALVSHPAVDRIHITGSTQTHDAIVWGETSEERSTRQQLNEPRLQVPISSELGNVSPWIVVPGEYSEKQLRFQAENVVASIVNNASFNCLATKLIVTARHWKQRDRFLALIEKRLSEIPPRYAYYPGAAARWERFTGETPPDEDYLPWKLIRDADPRESPHLFQEESFVCVCTETALEAESEADFLERAVTFVNQDVWGTLCATITVPNRFRKQEAVRLEQAIARLNYGAVAVNHWPALNYAFMTTPWGGAPGTDLREVVSGMGNVHNTFFLADVEKTVLFGPLTLIPYPVWFPSHPHPEAVGWRLLDLYTQPSMGGLLRVGLSVVMP